MCFSVLACVLSKFIFYICFTYFSVLPVLVCSVNTNYYLCDFKFISFSYFYFNVLNTKDIYIIYIQLIPAVTAKFVPAVTIYTR